MARVIMDDAPFQAHAQPNGTVHNATWDDKVARVRGAASLVKDVATSPLTSGLVRGGQAIGQLLQDAAAARLKSKQEQRKSEASLDAAQRLQDDDGLPEAQRTNDESEAFSAGMSLSGEPDGAFGGLRLSRDDAPRGVDSNPDAGSELQPVAPPIAEDRSVVDAWRGLSSRMPTDSLRAGTFSLAEAAERRLAAQRAPKQEFDDNSRPGYLPDQAQRVQADRTDAPAGGTSYSRRGPETVAPPSAPESSAGLNALTAPSIASMADPVEGARRTEIAQAPITLGSATNQQLDAARNKLQAALSRATPEQRSIIQQRIDAIDRQVDGRRATSEMATAEDERPRTVAEIHEMARMATTNEQQAKVLKLIGNARAPITSFADLISDQPQTQLMEEASKLFPTAPKRTADQDLADEQRAEWYREKSATEKAVRDGEVKKRLAQGENLGAKTKTEDALRPGKVDKLDADTGLVIENTADVHSRHRMRDKMLQPQIDKITAETSKINQSTASIKAKMAAIRAGRGNGVAAGSKAEKADIDAFVKLVGVHKTIVGEAKTASASANKAVSEAQSRAAAALKAASSVQAPGAKPSAPRAGSPVDLIEQYQSDLAKWQLKDGAYKGVQQEKEDSAADLDTLKTLRDETLREERDAQDVAKTVDPLIATYRGRVEKRSGTKPYAPPAEGSTYQKGGHTFKIVNGKPELVG